MTNDMPRISRRQALAILITGGGGAAVGAVTAPPGKTKDHAAKGFALGAIASGAVVYAQSRRPQRGIDDTHQDLQRGKERQHRDRLDEEAGRRPDGNKRSR